ncbi:hypothetical protein J5N97_002726 [Dioscorea zingiberensis]|uniref:Cyclin-like domain-containing protein n=1 Tax=Dioscorea zingiberensis TaxID=325984 RepID=A0A9D5D5B8_9LILI|nr:hypothetical protein J5N97_002726 [Dioscorea zingiberensis]
MDPLCCQEEELWDPQSSPLPINGGDAEHHLHLLELLPSLLSKESRGYPHSPEADGQYLGVAREEVVSWVARATARIGFSATTLFLAVDYLDRCFLPGAGAGLRLQPDKPWMARLSAIACLSLAAKVEEVYVPLLLDLQAIAAADDGPGSYLFEPKTIRRMELLVLSALGWRMNPVTPLSFIELLPSSTLCSATCTHALLSAIADWRWVRYPPSVWASAAILHAIGDADQETQSFLALLNGPKEHVEECCLVIQETARHNHKHIALNYYSSCPASPNAVVGSCFSCESSSVPSSPDRPSRRPLPSSPNRPSKRPRRNAGDGEELGISSSTASLD